jgi:hypothetical protein
MGSGTISLVRKYEIAIFGFAFPGPSRLRHNFNRCNLSWQRYFYGVAASRRISKWEGTTFGRGAWRGFCYMLRVEKTLRVFSTTENPGTYILGNYPKATVVFSCL